MKLLTSSGGFFAEVDVLLPTRGQSVVDFGAGATDTQTVVTGQSGITALSSVLVQVVALDSPDHSADEHRVEALCVTAGAIVPGTGFTVFARTDNVRLFGRFNVAWLWM